jgi:CDGSH-type Zn-finger protein
VSILRPGDGKFHYSDGSHKRIAPDADHDQVIWDEQVRQHKHGHLRNERPKVLIRRLV